MKKDPTLTDILAPLFDLAVVVAAFLFIGLSVVLIWNGYLVSSVTMIAGGAALSFWVNKRVDQRERDWYGDDQ